MGRQRTIDDQNFWRSPALADLTQEDKATLLYLLTSPFSNIIGCYQIVPRIAAAEMGWTEDQMLRVIARLGRIETPAGDIELVRFNKISGHVWVRVWWQHNSARGAFSTKLGVKAKEQLQSAPSEWLSEYLDELNAAGVDTLSIGYPYPNHTPPGNYNHNSISNSTTTPLSSDKRQTAPNGAGSGGVIDLFINAAGQPAVLLTKRSMLSKVLGSASEDQARWAGTAWRETIEAGKAESAEGLAVTLCRLAAQGGVTRPKRLAELESKQATAVEAANWQKLRELAGRKYKTPLGVAEINPGGMISLPGGAMSGPAALQALSHIESGAWQPA